MAVQRGIGLYTLLLFVVVFVELAEDNFGFKHGVSVHPDGGVFF